MMQLAKKLLKSRHGVSSQEIDEGSNPQPTVQPAVHYHPCVTDQLAPRGVGASPVNIPSDGPTKRRTPRLPTRTRLDSVDGDVDSELSFLQVQSLPDLTGSDTTKVVPDVVPQGQAGLQTTDKEAIKILWPGAAGSVTSSEYEDITDPSTASPHKRNLSIERIDDGKKDLSTKEISTSPPQSQEAVKQARQSPQLSLVKQSGKISYNTGGGGSALSPVKAFVKSKRQRNPRFKTLTGPVVLTDDETLDDRSGAVEIPVGERDPASRLRDRRKEGGWRSSSLTEKSKTGESTEDLNSSTEILQEPSVASVKADAISTSSGSIPVSRLDDFTLLASSDLEENQLFTIIKAESVVDSKGTLPLPNLEALQALNEYRRQHQDEDASNVAFLCPYVSRSTGSRFTSLSSRDMHKQHSGEQNLFARNSKLSQLLSLKNGPAHLTPVLGSQSIGRYLFLFPEFLLIAKQKSITSFKLKMKIPITDLWVSPDEDLLESSKHPDRSFLIGWPVVNMIVSFSTPEHKKHWLDLLHRQINIVRSQVEPENRVNLKIIYRKKEFSVTKSLNLLPLETADQFLERCLVEFRLNQSTGSSKYHLRIVSGDIITNTLLGCECPYSIKMAAERDNLGSQTRKKLYSSRHNIYGGPPGADFHIELFEKSNRMHRSLYAVGDTPRKGDRARSPLVILFKRPRSDPQQHQGQAVSRLFGRDLAELCTDDKLPPAVMDLLQFLYTYGPLTEGVFRKTASIKLISEFRGRLEAGELYSTSETSVSLAAGLLKEYLRALPDCLLCSGLYTKWVQTAIIEESEQRQNSIRALVDKMPDGHRLLLRHLVSVLQRISDRSSYNKMTASNLATCIGPTLLCASSTATASQVSDMHQIRELIEEMIDYAQDLFGDLSGLLKDSDPDEGLIGMEEKMAKSGTSGDYPASDTDSFHSLLAANNEPVHVGKHAHTTSDGYDCLACSARADLSPTSVSRDSGLSISNNHLFDDDVTAGVTTPSSSPQRQQLDEPRRFNRNVKIKSNSPSSTLAVSSRSRPHKLSDISEASQAASMSVEEDHAPTSASGRMAASRTAKERINKFQKSASGDSQIGSMEDNHYTSSDDESLYGRSSEHNDADDDNQESTDESVHMLQNDLVSSGSGEKHDFVEHREIEEHLEVSPSNISSVIRKSSSEARRFSSNVERKSGRIEETSSSCRLSDDDRSPKHNNLPRHEKQFVKSSTSSVNHAQPQLSSQDEAFMNEILKRADQDLDLHEKKEQHLAGHVDNSKYDSLPLSNEEAAFMDGLLKKAEEGTGKHSPDLIMMKDSVKVKQSSAQKPAISTKPSVYLEAPAVRNENFDIENQGDISPKGKKLARRSRHTVSGTLSSNIVHPSRDIQHLSPPDVINLQKENRSYGSYVDKKTPLARRHTDNAVRAQRKRDILSSNIQASGNYQSRYVENPVRDYDMRNYEIQTQYNSPGYRPRKSNEDCASISSHRSVASQTENVQANNMTAGNQSHRKLENRSHHGVVEIQRPFDSYEKTAGQSQIYVSKENVAANRPHHVDRERLPDYKDSPRDIRREQQQLNSDPRRRRHTDIQRKDVLQAKSVNDYMEKNHLKVEVGNKQSYAKSDAMSGSNHNEVESGSRSIADYIKSREQEIQRSEELYKRPTNDINRSKHGENALQRAKAMSLDLTDEQSSSDLVRRQPTEVKKFSYYKESSPYRFDATRSDLSKQSALKVIYPDAVRRQHHSQLDAWNQRPITEGNFEALEKSRPLREERILISKPVQRSNSKDEYSYVNVNRISRLFDGSNVRPGEPQEFYFQPSEEQLRKPRELPSRTKAARSTSLGRKYIDMQNRDMGVRKCDLDDLDARFKNMANINQAPRNANTQSYYAERLGQRFAQEEMSRNDVKDLRNQRWSPVHMPNASIDVIKKTFESSKPSRSNLPLSGRDFPSHGRERTMAASIDSKRMPRQDSTTSRISSASEDRKQVTVVSITNTGNTYIRQRDTTEGTDVGIPDATRSAKTASIDGSLTRTVNATRANLATKPPQPQLLQAQRYHHNQIQQQRQDPQQRQWQQSQSQQQYQQQQYQQQQYKQQQPVQQRSLHTDGNEADYWDVAAMSGNVQKLRSVYSPHR